MSNKSKTTKSSVQNVTNQSVSATSEKESISSEMTLEDQATTNQTTIQSKPHDFSVGGNFRSKMFPQNVIEAAELVECSTKLPACISLAQWAQESGYGKFDLGANNPFGIKWTKGLKFDFVERSTKEWVNGHYMNVVARFVKFPSIETAFQFHGQMLMNPHGPYAVAVPYAYDWYKFVQRMAPIYATDPEYAQHLYDLIEQWKLYEFTASAALSNNPSIESA